MPERITPNDVIRAAESYRAACERAGIECGRLIVERGSATNGNAWRLVNFTDRRSTPPIGSDVLGYDRSARSAYHDLITRTRAIDDMRTALAPRGTELHAATENGQDR